MKDDDDDFEEKEILLYANFEKGRVDSGIFQNSDLKFKVIGLDSGTPIIQLGDQTFKGTWIHTIGTRVFLEEDPSPEQVDPVFAVKPPQMLKYKCLSTKTLNLSKIFLKSKNANQTESKNSGQNDYSCSVNKEQEEL